MRFRFLISVLSVVLAVSVLGCSSNSTGQTREQAAPKKEPSTGNTEYHDSNGLISISMPNEWVEDTESFIETFKKFGDDQLVDRIVFGGGKPISGGYDPNIVVTSDDWPENAALSFITDTFVIGSVNGNSKVIAKNPIQVSGHPGELIEIENNGSSSASRSLTSIIYVTRESRLWVLQCNVEDDFSEYDRCVESMSTIKFN